MDRVGKGRQGKARKLELHVRERQRRIGASDDTVPDLSGGGSASRPIAALRMCAQGHVGRTPPAHLFSEPAHCGSSVTGTLASLAGKKSPATNTPLPYPSCLRAATCDSVIAWPCRCVVDVAKAHDGAYDLDNSTSKRNSRCCSSAPARAATTSPLHTQFRPAASGLLSPGLHAPAHDVCVTGRVLVEVAHGAPHAVRPADLHAPRGAVRTARQPHRALAAACTGGNQSSPGNIMAMCAAMWRCQSDARATSANDAMSLRTPGQAPTCVGPNRWRRREWRRGNVERRLGRRAVALLPHPPRLRKGGTHTKA